MKKLILVLAVFAGVYTTVEAQQQKGKGQRERGQNMNPEQRAEQHASRLQKTLNLTDAQKKAIYDADVNTAKQVQPLKQDQQLTREKIKALQQQREEQMKAILTADQYKKLQDMHAERRSKMAKRHAERKMQNRQALPTENK